MHILGPLSQAEPKKRTNQAITINECMNVMRKRAVKACFLTILVNSPLTLENTERNSSLQNPLIHFLRKTKDSLKNLMTGYIKKLVDKLKN